MVPDVQFPEDVLTTMYALFALWLTSPRTFERLFRFLTSDAALYVSAFSSFPDCTITERNTIFTFRVARNQEGTLVNSLMCSCSGLK